MEHERKTFPLKPTVIAPASHNLIDEINTRSADASRVDPCGAFPCVPEAARYKSDGRFVLPKTETVMPSHVALSGAQATARFTDQYEMPENAIPAHVETKKHIRVPQIQSMDDYIKCHYAHELMTGMVNDITLRAGTAGVIREVYDDTFHIDHMSFWRHSRTELVALLKMRLDVCRDKSDQIDRYTEPSAADRTEGDEHIITVDCCGFLVGKVIR